VKMEHMYVGRNRLTMSDVARHGIDVHGEVSLDKWDVTIVAKEKREFCRRYLESKRIAEGDVINKSCGIITM
jgi:hypothetical protein